MIYQFRPVGAGHGGSKKQAKGQQTQKGAKMAYKKPEVIAKSEAKQSFVAGCPEKRPPLNPQLCAGSHSECYIGKLR